MLLPVGFQNVEDYFEGVMQFLCEHQWVYRYSLTKLLVEEVFNYIPPEWQTALQDMSSNDLAAVASASSKGHWPQSLLQFLQKCESLQFGKSCDTEGWQFSSQLQKGLTPKKQHEVSQLAGLVHKECEKFSITKILDIGSGLGYLDLVLHFELGYNVLGLESKANLVSSASQKAFAFCNACESISFIQYAVIASVDKELREILEKRLLNAKLQCTCHSLQGRPEKGVHETTSNATCLVGLHTCGDLSAACANLFLQLPQIRMMILIPCCYHKMEIVGEKKEENSTNIQSNFVNFPRSQTLTALLRKKFPGYEEYLGRPFLRLASQESSLRWRNWTESQHKERSENLMSRAVLELGCYRLGFSLKKKHRRCVRKSHRNNFESFIEDVVGRYDFVSQNDTTMRTEEVMIKTKELWLQYSKLCGLAYAYTSLQAAMQPCIETFVLVDKMVYMQEQQNQQLSFDVVKIMNADISPRCHGLIVRKLKESAVT